MTWCGAGWVVLAATLAVCAPCAAVRAQAAPAPAAAAPAPYDGVVARRMAEASRAPGDPRSALALIDAWRQWDRATQTETARRVGELAKNRRASAAMRGLAGYLASRAALRMGRVDDARRMITELGYLRAWLVVGPFDDEGKRGFAREYEPERQRSSPLSTSATFEGRERAVSWRVAPIEAPAGYVPMDAMLRPAQHVCGYAETYVRFERAQWVALWSGAGGAHKVWWNGDLVTTDPRYRSPDPDRMASVVAARSGWNRVLVKTCVEEGSWGFFVRLTDGSGRPVSFSVEANPERSAGVVGDRPTSARPSAPTTFLAAFERAATPPAGAPAAGAQPPARAPARGAQPSARALEDLARFLVWTAADDPAERRAPDLAAQAARLEPTPERLVLAAELASERAGSMAHVRRATELFPDEPRVMLLEARMRHSGPSPEDALSVVARIPETAPERYDGALIRASILRGLGLPLMARREIHALRARYGSCVSLLRELAAAADSAALADEGIAFRRELVATRFDLSSERRDLAEDALRRDDEPTVRRELETVATLWPDDPGTLAWSARVYEALGDREQTLATLHRATQLAPESPVALTDLARTLLRLGQRDQAAITLRRVLALTPQNAEVRDLLEQLAPATRPDEAYAEAPRTFLARRTRDRGYPIRFLQRLTVNTVFDNGLGSTFRQVAVQVNDEEGARAWRSYSIQFDPESQRIEVRSARVYRRDGRVDEATRRFERSLSEPWYSIYYDTRAMVVVFPDLEPGDSVELRYRIDDVAHRNMFADYYGDLEYLQDDAPIAHLDHVLITPRARTFYFNRPALPSLRREEQVRGEQRVYRFTADDVPAVEVEERGPGPSDFLPYLHVSTYRTWAEVGRWYWGLVRDQLATDDAMRRTAADLVRNLPDERAKVAAIYGYVLRSTRYVGLEFGIHGYKPYRVTTVLQRGFGDCKDKASLIVALLREVGIEARLVLVRTRRNGNLTDEPASLAIFDHAIAYVPSLDLYLDGTAEHSGSAELPEADQNVMVLVVEPEGESRIRRTPVTPASENRTTRTLGIDLQADGSALVDTREEVRGVEAAGLRDRYEAEGTRAERLEHALGAVFPGASLESSRFVQLADIERPVVIEHRLRVPQIARRDGDALVLAPTTIGQLTPAFATRSSRRFPLELGATTEYVEERTVNVPAGMHVESVPADANVQTPFGALELRTERAARRVIVRARLAITVDRVPPDRYGELRRFFERVDEALRQRITFARGESR
ncbi:MAG: DUF3857 domain-containing protein [Deltaproteobacteria bacterium]|nr:DUF3857 domain-containing protein [Deltaproteobacteria bacterium]